MLGWDVGYVWPLLEGVVVTQVTNTVNPWHIIMGNPRDVLRTQQEAGASAWPDSHQVPQGQVRISNVEPPPYEERLAPPTANFGVHTVESGTRLHQELHQSNSGESNPQEESCQRATSANSDGEMRNRRREEDHRRPRTPHWQQSASAIFACLFCVLGVSNLSRFSLLVYIYKGSFIIQFLILSAVFGIPLLYFLMALGQYLGAGLLGMWYIAPAFKGIGFSLLYVYILLGVYNAIPLSWLFVYFKDSFITLKDSYKWGKCHYTFASNVCQKALNASSADYYGWSVPSYFHGRVLGRRAEEYHFGELKFETAFNLCLVWLIVFICLSRGPKTLGKVVYVIGTLPLVFLLMVTLRMGQQWGDGIINIFSTSWVSNFMDSATWTLAAKETFLIWGLMGAVALHVCSHNKISTNITKVLISVVFVAIIILIMASFLLSCLVNVFTRKNLTMAASSFEEELSIQTLRSSFLAIENMTVSNLVIGESFIITDDPRKLSGYQVLRLATEIFPSALAVEGVRSISSFWAICFYSTMILFGLGQQVVLWYCVVESIIAINYKVFRVWHTTTTFITCNLAFLLGLPMTSNIGIYIVFFLDFCIGSLWWIVLTYSTLLLTFLFVRARTHATFHLVSMMVQNNAIKSWVLPLLAFQWNCILPITVLVLFITLLRLSAIDPSSTLHSFLDGYTYWPPWVKILAQYMQLLPIFLITATAAYQTFKILVMKTDLPFSERVKYLCCPVYLMPSITRRPLQSASANQGSTNSAFIDDPPPKYSPPPSYSTATSRMLAKRTERPATTFSIDCESMEDDISIADDEFLTISAPSSRRGSAVSHFSELPRTNANSS